jgi:hypothetical protein
MSIDFAAQQRFWHRSLLPIIHIAVRILTRAIVLFRAAGEAQLVNAAGVGLEGDDFVFANPDFFTDLGEVA